MSTKTYSLLVSIERKIKQYCPITPPPGASWSITRSLLEFLDFCLSDDECRFELKQLFEKFQNRFHIAKTPSPSVRAVLLLLQKEQKQEDINRASKTKTGKAIGKVDGKIPLDKVIHNE